VRRKIVLFLLSVCLLFAFGSVVAIVLITRTTSDLGRLVELHQIKGLRQNHSYPYRLIPSNANTVFAHLYTGLLLFAGYVVSGFLIG